MKTLLFAAVLTANISFADNLAFDRGLPTANLNNAAGANRSNVAWADWEPVGTTTWAVGDNFKFGTAGQNYNIGSLRVWIVEGSTTSTSSSMPYTSSLTLYGRVSGDAAPATVLSSGYTATRVTYADGQAYQGSSGSYIQLWQIDFANLNWSVFGDTLYDFYVGGTDRAYSGSIGGQTGPFLSASNAALSGGTQQGVDNRYYSYDQSNNVLYTNDSGTDHSWDKSSDINVQVFTTPEPGFYLELAIGLAAVSFLFVRRRRHADC